MANAVASVAASASAPAAPGRVFLVGCPRSGTTLLQAMLAAHPAVDSLPETHFFQRLLRCEDHRRLPRAMNGLNSPVRRLQAARRHWMAQLGWAGRRQVRQAWRAMPEPAGGVVSARTRTQIAGFVAALDGRCAAAGKRIWIEKTPDHLFYIRHIQREVAGARFIHLLRDGDEVVASLYDAACRYPDWAPFQDLERAAERWNAAACESLQWLGHPQHLVVRYEALLAAPEAVLRQIAAFMGCAYAPSMLEPATRAQSVVRADEPWKQPVAGALQDRRKFHRVFEPQRQQQVRARVLRIDWEDLSRRVGVIARL